jgi:hypothetical protein
MKLETFPIGVDIADDPALDPSPTVRREFSDDVCSDLKPGEYRLRELLHTVWDIIMSFDRDYPKRFKGAALAGEVDDVLWLGEDFHGVQVYQLLKKR